MISKDDCRIIQSDSPTLALMVRLFETQKIENAIDAGKVINIMAQALAKEIDVKLPAIYQAIESKQIKTLKSLNHSQLGNNHTHTTRRAIMALLFLSKIFLGLLSLLS